MPDTGTDYRAFADLVTAALGRLRPSGEATSEPPRSSRREVAAGQKKRREELARRLGVASLTVYRWETGKCLPDSLAQEAFQQFLEQEARDLAEAFRRIKSGFP